MQRCKATVSFLNTYNVIRILVHFIQKAYLIENIIKF